MGDPSRLVVTPLLQPVIDTMWRTSPTFKARCARLRQAPSLIVTVSIGSRSRVGAARGRVYVDESAGLAARADILIAQDFQSFAYALKSSRTTNWSTSSNESMAWS